VAIDGTQALVGSTFTACATNKPSECETFSNPAAIFSSGKTFKVLWTETLAALTSPSGGYSLTNCKRVGSKWYVYE
jgi:hypothetical protein